MKPTYIRINSDLHLEAFNGTPFDKLVNKFVEPDPRDEASILLLAGDISSVPTQLTGFIKELEQRFMRVFVVNGNHEFYRHDYDQHNKELSQLFSQELKNTSHSFNSVKSYIGDGWRIIYGTLWADGGKDLSEQARVNYALNDFRLITLEGMTFNVRDMIKIHKREKAKIKSFLAEPFDGKTIVMTHHLPSYALCHPRFGDQINGGFASKSDELIYEYQPNLWVAGHTHDRISKVIDKTRIEVNPTGYRGEWNTQFSGGLPLFLEFGFDF